MKKWLALLLAAVMVFSLCACGEKGTESKGTAIRKDTQFELVVPEL